ncbi:MAG: acyl-CoA synthetase, partial [Deltaproteobacteria bacterium]|nr:acyl-CoA synthetase [Deltaproteobacteria bacterium]
HLQQAVGERAAIPKEVYIVDEMPLTTVGKIFKPALKREVIKNVYLDDLQALGDMVEQIDIEIGEDKIHGSLAVITVKAAQSAEKDKIRRRVDELLAAYTTRYQVIIND